MSVFLVVGQQYWVFTAGPLHRSSGSGLQFVTAISCGLCTVG